MAPTARGLYAYAGVTVETQTVEQAAIYGVVNVGYEEPGVQTDNIYPYVNIGVEVQEVETRDLYGYVNVAVEALEVLARALYGYVNITDDDPFPWIESISPTTGTTGTLVTIIGNGFNTAQGTQRVELGGVIQSVSSWAWQQVEINISPGSASGYIRIVRPDPTLYYSNAKYFRFEATQISGAPYWEIRIYDDDGNFLGIAENAQ